VQIYDVVEDSGGAYIVMEYIDGGSLQDHLSQNGRPDEEKALRIFIQLCNGLAQAHKKDIVHRDIKPSNVLITLDGTAKLTDFGIARMAEIGDMTMTGVTMGTPIYMSPEQERDAKHVDVRADIYSLGATLYELLTGDLPRVIEIDNIPERFRGVVRKAIEKLPEDRYQGIEKLLEALEHVKKELIPGRIKDDTKEQKEAGERLDSKSQATVNKKDGSEMILIPAGEFLMGAGDNDQEALDGEKPQHKVCLDAYYIGKYPVTIAQYRVFCSKTGRKMPREPWWGSNDDHPVVNVDWGDAVAYCRWVGGRLPTEAEWEKAARGIDGRTYPWGEDVPDSYYANYGVMVDATTPVGSYPKGASPYGVLDMAGNVWEWCSDWYGEDYYRGSPEYNPKGSTNGSYHVFRGGSWNAKALVLRASFRCLYTSDFDSGNLGFRLARTP
jgi:serine/threonine-protein kinase